jgi:hypothetical protein
MSIPQHYLKSQFFLQIRKPVGTKLDSGARTNFESSVPNDQEVVLNFVAIYQAT